MKFIKKLFSFLLSLVVLTLSLSVILYRFDLIPKKITEIFIQEDPLCEEIRQRLETKNVYPFYSSLSSSEKEAYIKICAAAEKRDTDYFDIGCFDEDGKSLDGANTYDDIVSAVLYEQPQYFWLDLGEYFILKSGINPYKKSVSIKISYSITDDEFEKAKENFNIRKEKFLNLALQKETTYEKVLFVHDTIVKICDYDFSLLDEEKGHELERSAYGCLVEGKTVCTGYTQLFTLMMQELGFECGAQTNKKGDHIWNYCLLDGDYYYFDVTWDDPSFKGEGENLSEGHISHNYFGLTKNELALTHDLDENSSVPLCEGTKYNYYAYNGLYVPEYDFDKISVVLKKQFEANGDYAEVRFKNSAESKKAENDLITDRRIFDIVDSSEISYCFSNSNLHLYISLK
ncbi:MAG: transglutaminase domain-containing protein [Acutalibacteraceae bacterium]